MVGEVARYARLIIDFLGDEGKTLHEFAAFLWQIGVPSEVLYELRRLRVFEWFEVDGQVLYVVGEGASLFKQAPSGVEAEEKSLPSEEELAFKAARLLARYTSVGVLWLMIELGLDPKDGDALWRLRNALKALEALGWVELHEEMGVVNYTGPRLAPAKTAVEASAEKPAEAKRGRTLVDFLG